MSFRGEDTRMGFTSHLCKALTQHGIKPYKDDTALEIGKPISSELLQAIETSRVAVVVLSANFATSRWCLEEIAKIVDCKKQRKLILIPIFYHVSPSDVRHQSNCFEQGFAAHEADTEIAPEKVKAWRAAFKEVGAVSGLHVTQHRDEAEVVSKVVSNISRYLSDKIPIDLPKSLVGIESRVDEVKRMLSMESSEVLFVGICGMSGIGKTTLAEAVYKDIKSEFKKSSLVENIKDISKQNDSTDLCKLQQKLLNDILVDQSVRVQSVIHGQSLLGARLQGLKVIIVLDDVDHDDQLTYLAGGLEWFGPGSRIIVTTTNRELLKPHIINNIYSCEEMKDDEALSLFCQSAFNQSRPTHGYEKLSDDIVKLAGGLPLALSVYGSLLCGKDENYWKYMLKKLREYPEKKVRERLEVVYARLDEDQRDTFMYITDLVNKCLITINLENNVWMHDLLQQLCWKILCRKSDQKHIAIKSHEDVVDVLSNNPKGTHTIEVINQEPYNGEVNDHFIDPMCFSKMKKLKFLRISNVHFPEGLRYLSNDLRILEWYGCSLKSFPSMFEPKHIYELEMCSSQLKTIWTKDLELHNLRSINLSFSKDLSDIPNLTSAPNLAKLNLEGCTSLKSLHESVLLHKRLRYLNLKGCTCLQSLGRSCMEMEALKALILSGCSEIVSIPEFGKNMKRLEHLYVDGTRIKKLPENLGELCNLKNLDASGTFIEELPSTISRLKKLRVLHVNSCRLSFNTGYFLNPSLDTLSSGLKEVDLSYCNLSVVPDGIGLLCHLITLDLSGNEFVSLPTSIGLLSKLRMLCLNNCERLQSLPKLSLVDEDMDYGPRSRFNYHVRAKEIIVSKFNALSFNNRPTVLCLNCSTLAVDKRGSNLAEKILNNYLELRSMKYWMTPEAVFQIVGAGSEIPLEFVETDYRGLILQGPWIGVAICAVITANHVNGYMGSAHMVTAHIRLGGKHLKVPIPIHFLEEDSETQIILYWTIVDDPQRVAAPSSAHWGIFDVSFGVEPDSKLKVTKVGVRFIREEYIMCLKRPEDKIKVGEGIHKDISLRYEPYMNACSKDGPNLQRHTPNIVNFILDYGSQHNNNSLFGIYQITTDLLKVNQEFLRILGVYLRKWWGEKFVYCYYAISLGVSVLYKDFIRSLKVMNDGWLSVKLALEQILIKSKADNYHSYEEMKQHLKDLEATHSVEFSDNFITMFLCICRRTFDFLFTITAQLSDNPQNKESFGMYQEDELPGILRKDASLGILPTDAMLLEDVLTSMARQYVLPRKDVSSEVLQMDVMLRKYVLPRIIREDELPRILREDVLPKVLRETVMRMLREDGLRRIRREDDLRRMLREDVVLGMLLEDELPRMLLEELAKISSNQIAGVICMMVVFMGNFEHLIKEMKDTVPLHSLWQHLFKACTDVKDHFTTDGWFMMKPHYNCKLQISEFSRNRILLQQLMNTMSRSDCFTKENEEEMKSVIDKLQNNIHEVSSTIQEMSNIADQYYHNLWEARNHVASYHELSKDDNIMSMLPLFNRN